MLTASRLRELLDYDPETGTFVWRKRVSQSIRAGSVGGASDARGYRVIKIDGKKYYSHRLAWLYVSGLWPDRLVDHADGDKSNNALRNLRLAGPHENARNRIGRRDSAVGMKGVVRRGASFQASIKIDGHTHSLGYFPTAIEGNAAYGRAARRYFGDFACAGRCVE